MILAHTMGGAGEDYGGDEVRLEVATAAMRKVCCGTALSKRASLTP